MSDAAPFQLRVARREMIADIAGSDRAEQRIGERVQPGIGIAVADKAVAVRDGDAAQPDMIAGAEAMDIEAAGSARGEGRGDHGRGFGKISAARHLESAFVAGRHRDLQPGGHGDGQFIGGAGRCGAVRGEQRGKAEGLRRLHAPQSVAIDRGFVVRAAAAQAVD